MGATGDYDHTDVASHGDESPTEDADADPDSTKGLRPRSHYPDAL